MSLLRFLARFCWHFGLMNATRVFRNCRTARPFERRPAAVPVHLHEGGDPTFKFSSTTGSPATMILSFLAYPPTPLLDRSHISPATTAWLTCMTSIHAVRRGDPIPSNAVALTFDDGYRDNYELGLPILKRNDAPATVFLTSGFVNQDDVLWNDKVSFALKHTRKTALRLSHNAGEFYALDTPQHRLAPVAANTDFAATDRLILTAFD